MFANNVPLKVNPISNQASYKKLKYIESKKEFD